MSSNTPPPNGPPPGIVPLDLEVQSRQSLQAVGNLIERLTPWLFAFGSWIFGGLIAFTLLIVASLLAVGPVHPAILVSIAAFACALPLDVAGLFLLKLIQEMKDVPGSATSEEQIRSRSLAWNRRRRLWEASRNRPPL